MRRNYCNKFAYDQNAKSRKNILDKKNNFIAYTLYSKNHFGNFVIW